MDLIKEFKTSMLDFSLKEIPNLLPLCSTETQTRASIIDKFLKILGYDSTNPLEVSHEFIADVGIKKGEKVDYAILKNKEDVILIECKLPSSKLTEQESGQLIRYYQATTTKSKFAIFTNGVKFKFYSEFEEPNKMDLIPFFEFDITKLKDDDLNVLSWFHKEFFVVNRTFETMRERYYVIKLKNTISSELNAPSREFKQLLIKKVFKDRLSESNLLYYTPFIDKALNEMRTS